jgi:iron complex outermembrane recepter protein
MLKLNGFARSCCVSIWVLAASSLGALTAHAATATFEIEPQDLSGALKAFAVQSHREIFFAPELTRGRQSKGVKGQFDDLKALNIILEGTGLDFSVTTSNAILVRDPTSKRESSREPVTPTTPTTPTTGQPTKPSLTVAKTPSAQYQTPDNANLSSSSVPSGSERAGLTEIIVTAQKREESLLDVPVPVTALNAEALAENNQLRLQDYYTSVPGLSVTPQASGSSQSLAIRGITTGVSENPTVGITVDDVPFGSSTLVGSGGWSPIPDIDPGDLARIEVLRGPQGTLYGADSMGGLVKFVTVDPSTSEFSGRVQSGVNTVYNGAELGYNIRGSVNIPLSDSWAVRASAFAREDPGYIDNIETGEDGVNRAQVYGARLAAMWKPSEALSLKLSALYQEYEGNGFADVDQAINGYSGPPLQDLQQYYLRGTGRSDRQVQAYSAVLKAKVGTADLTSITGLNINRFSDSYDTTYLFGPITQYGGPGTAFTGFGVPGTPAPETSRTDKVTQEVRLTDSLGSIVDWLVGAFYTHESSHYHQDLNAEDSTTGAIVGQDLSITFPSSYEEYAGFADVTLRITDQFNIQLGGRETHIRQTYSEVDAGPVVPYFYGVPSPHVIAPLDADADSFTFLVTPQFKISSDLMTYARIASGYRAGGVNTSAGAAGVPTQYSPDKTTNYEVGAKGDPLGGLLSFDASVYYIDWKDIQFFEVVNGFGFTTNGSGAKSEGVELSLAVRPSTGLKIGGWVSWDEAELTQPFPSTSTAYGAPGNRLPYSARISGNIAVDQNFPLSETVTGFVGSTVSYVGSREGEFASIATGLRQEYPAYAKTDLRAGAKLDDWSLNLYVNNLTDRRGLLSGGLNSSPPFAFIVLQPRTVGLSLTKTF